MPFALAALSLVFITLVWGTTFVVVKDALETVPVSLLLALRFGMSLLLLLWVRIPKGALLPGFTLGLITFAGFSTQTLGLDTTTASKAAFITGLSVILTPLLSAVWFKNRVPVKAFTAAFVALAGLGLMTLTSAQGIVSGDLWVLGTAFCYATYIIYLGEIAKHHKAITLSATQLWPMTLLAWLWALPHVGTLPDVPLTTYGAIFYLAAIATVLVSVLQVRAQRIVPAYLAALIFVLEPVFAAVFAYVVRGEALGTLGWLGGGLIIVAMLISEVRWEKVGKWKQRQGRGTV